MKITIVSLLTFLFVQLNAQEIGIKWGKGTNTGDETNPTKFIGSTKDHIYTFRHKLSGVGQTPYYIEKYNKKDLTLVSVKQFDKGGYYLSDIFLIDGKLIWLTHEKRNLYVCYWDPKTETGTDKKLILKFGKWDIISAKLSEDKKQILVYSDMLTDNKFQYKVIDGALNIKDYQLDYTFKEDETRIKFILNNNNLYILTGQTRPKEDFTHKEGEGNDKTYTLGLLSHNFKNNTLEQLALKSKSLHFINLTASVHPDIRQVDLKMDEASNLLVSAVYTTEQNVWEEYNGLLFYKVNSEKLQIITTTELDLDKNTLLKSLTEKENKDGRKILGLQINNIITKEDGKVLIIAEPYFKLNNMGQGNTWNNAAKSIIVSSVNITGQVEWTTVIPKLQAMGDMWKAGKYFSYLPIYKNQTLYLLYNDNPANLLVENFADLKMFSDRSLEGSVLVQATVKQDGTLSKKTLLIYEKNAMYINPAYYLPVSDNEMIIQGSNGETEALGRLKY